MKLNELRCKNAKHDNPKSKAPKKLADGQGLYLFAMPNGSKYWRFLYRINEKQKTLALGVYPEITLKEAREMRGEARELLDQGKDPALERKKQQFSQKKDFENTFEVIAREWYDMRKDQWKPRYAAEIIKRLEEDIFPHIGNYPIKDITPSIMLNVIKKIEARGAIDLAKRQLQKCGEIFRYACVTDRADFDPTNRLGEALRPVKKDHFAALDPEDLPEFLKVLNSNKARLFPTTLNLMKIMLLTFPRTMELINAQWDEFDFEKGLWIIPAERMKIRKQHIVPLATQTIELLHDQQDIAKNWPHVFPSPNKPRQVVCNNAITKALERMGYKGRMTGHGFRALAMSTIKQELGYRHEVIDRQLAHSARSKIDRAYDRAQFLEERKKMMQDWANYVGEISK